MEENVESQTLSATDDPVKKCYTPLFKRITAAQCYKEVSLHDFTPEDRYARRHWMDKLQLPFPTMIYGFPYRNHLGVAAFMWKIPDVNAIDQTQVARLVAKLNERQQFFATRGMRKDFIDHYSQHVNVSKSVLRNIYRSLTDDASSAVSEQTS